MSRFFADFRQTRPSHPAKGCGLLLVALVLLLAVLSACPAAHEWFHHDADHAEHECVVTLFTHGVTMAVAGAVLAVVAWRLLGGSPAAAREFCLPVLARRLPPGRAPPVD